MSDQQGPHDPVERDRPPEPPAPPPPPPGPPAAAPAPTPTDDVPPPGDLLSTLWGVVVRPARTLRQIAVHPDLRRTLLLIVVLNLVVAVVYVAAAQPTPGFEPDPLTRFIVERRGRSFLLGLVLAPTLGVLGYLLWTGLTWLFARMLDGEGSFRATLAALVHAAVPPSIVGIPLQFVPTAWGPMAVLAILPFLLVLAGWSLVLSVLAIRQAHDLTTGSAIGVVVLLIFTSFVVVILAVIVAVAMLR